MSLQQRIASAARWIFFAGFLPMQADAVLIANEFFTNVDVRATTATGNSIARNAMEGDNCTITALPPGVFCEETPISLSVSDEDVGTGAQVSALASVSGNGSSTLNYSGSVLQPSSVSVGLSEVGRFAIAADFFPPTAAIAPSLEIGVSAFFPEIVLFPGFTPDSEMTYRISIQLREPDNSVSLGVKIVGEFLTEGTVVTDANGVSIFSVSGEDIGAGFDAISGAFGVKDLFLDVVLGTVTTPSFSVSLSKALTFTGPNSVPAAVPTEGFFASIVDPFQIGAGERSPFSVRTVIPHETDLSALPPSPVIASASGSLLLLLTGLALLAAAKLRGLYTYCRPRSWSR